ncbi:hypothetical protein GALL_480990 [mine drainage metagenome]|uniref:Uncharacterized protein n=1 Tax=mine drainage metagenome TaxID=410659 RepID=A0A1J5PHN0_9ZZZZ
MIEHTDELHLGIGRDLVFEIGNDRIDVLASGFVFADFGDINRVFLLQQGLFHGGLGAGLNTQSAGGALHCDLESR